MRETRAGMCGRPGHTPRTYVLVHRVRTSAGEAAAVMAAHDRESGERSLLPPSRAAAVRSSSQVVRSDEMTPTLRAVA
jgi:hypothetical protein